jgi:hypothetical protein
VFRTRFSLLTSAAVAVGVAGCGGGGHPGVHPVRGQVLYDGKPVPDALVVFHPLDPAANKDAPRPRAKVESDGSFTIGTFDAQDGAPPGDYAVTVELWQSPATGKGGPQDEAPPRNRLPVRYSTVSSSGLRAHVDASDNQLPVFQLIK